MGPYVLRSVGAHFKLWDEGVQDSFTENLAQAPVGDVPDIPVNCNCMTTSAGPPGCCGASPCGANYCEYNHTCTPQGCDGAPSSSCVIDPYCCVCPVPLGAGSLSCGKVALPSATGGVVTGKPCSGPSFNVPTQEGSTTCLTPGNTCTTPPALSPPNCYYGYKLYHYQCGNSNASDICVQDGSCPMPGCGGSIDINAVACPDSPGTGGSDLVSSGYYQDQNNSLTGQCNTTTNENNPPVVTPTPCQYTCNNGFTFDASTGTCTNVPPDATVVCPGVTNQYSTTCGGGFCLGGYGSQKYDCGITGQSSCDGINNAAYLCSQAGFKYFLTFNISSNSGRWRSIQWARQTPSKSVSYMSDISTYTWSPGSTNQSCTSCRFLCNAICANSLDAKIPNTPENDNCMGGRCDITLPG